MRTAPAVLVLLLALVAVAPAPAAAPRPWSAVTTWGYQLQRPDPATLAASPFDLVVIDYSRDGSAERRFTPADVARMKVKPDGGRRLVVAYMSIGEAEPYRFYWRKEWRPGNPSWLLQPNPRWPDNYRVRYWDPDWQRRIFGSPESYLDQIVAAGFDGVYLDIVDGYEDFQKTRRSARTEMVDFVTAIAAHARRSGGLDFGVFPQNAPDLLRNRDYLEVITGIGKEEVYFLDTDEATEDEDRKDEEELLDRVVAAGKLVLTVDYCNETANVREAVNRSRRRGYIPYCSTVALDRLSTDFLRLLDVSPRPPAPGRVTPGGSSTGAVGPGTSAPPDVGSRGDGSSAGSDDPAWFTPDHEDADDGDGNDDGDDEGSDDDGDDGDDESYD